MIKHSTTAEFNIVLASSLILSKAFVYIWLLYFHKRCISLVSSSVYWIIARRVKTAECMKARIILPQIFFLIDWSVWWKLTLSNRTQTSALIVVFWSYVLFEVINKFNKNIDIYFLSEIFKKQLPSEKIAAKLVHCSWFFL